MKQSLVLMAIILSSLLGCTKKDPNFGASQKPVEVAKPIANDAKATIKPEEQGQDSAVKEANQCAVDLCGPAEKKAEFYGGGTLLAKCLENSKPFFTEEIKPLIDRNFSAINEAVKSEELHNLIEQLKKSELDASQKSLVVSIGLFKIFFLKQSISKLELFSSDGKGNVVVLRENVVTAFPEWSPDQIYDASATLNILMASDFFKAYMGWSGLTLDAYLQGSKIADRATAVKNLVKSVEAVKKAAGDGVFWSFDMSAFEALKAGKELKEWQKKEVMNIVTTTFLYMSVWTPEIRQMMVKVKFSVQDIENELKKISTEVRKKSKVNFTQSADVVRQQVMSQCQENVAQFLATAVTEERLNVHQKNIAFVKSAAQRTAKNYLEGESLEAGLKAIEQATFVNPPNESELRESLTTRMFSQAKKTRELLFWAEKMAKADAKNWQFFAGTLIISEFSQEPMYGERMMADACEGIKPSGPSDRAMESGAIQVGWQTVAFPDLGVGILAHEMGHVVSAAISKKLGNQKYADARMCTASAHEMLGMESAPAMQYAEEDWADAFSASVLNEVNLTWPYAKNYACALVGIDENQKDYVGTERWNKPTIDGKHSPSLLRALLIQSSMGKELPASCQQMVARSSAKPLPACAK